ncbi:hypothetical protein ATY81_21950 [Rhizobium sp. R72]|nr:hypothetical protein ATY81_21950 [Rhizobium sp. R72]OWW02452.1 hypothetical protein ATY80_21950 [Rhizobium sp. R711]
MLEPKLGPSIERAIARLLYRGNLLQLKAASAGSVPTQFDRTGMVNCLGGVASVLASSRSDVRRAVWSHILVLACIWPAPAVSIGHV